MTTSNIAINDLGLSLGGKTIFNHINTDFVAGELTVLLGPNGAGKSSLLKSISGEYKSQGKISVFGKDKSQWKPQELARHVGFLPQSSSLTFNFTAREVVELGAIPLIISNQELQKVVDNSMAAVDIQHLAERPFPLLSGGEKQRVHLARVLTQLSQSGDNQILMLDEPTSALDLSHQHSTLKLAREYADNGATVIVVLHDLNLAAQYADRLLILNKGALVAEGTPWQVLTTETIQDVYRYPVEVIKHPQGNHPVLIT